MLKANCGAIRGNKNCNSEKVVYKTFIPIHLLDYSLYELDKEIKENNVGSMMFKTMCNSWVGPIINLDITYNPSIEPLWTETDGKFTYAKKEYTDIVSVVIAGYKERASDYYSDINTRIQFFVVPCNEDTAEGKQTQLGLDAFEKYPAYYEITKKTKKTFTFRYREILDRFPMSLESRPMLLPLEYLQQEFCMNAYVSEEVTDGENTYEARLPVVRFWEEIDGELQAQFYTYEHKTLNGKRHIELIDRMVEVTLKKVNPQDVKQGDDWFYINKKFVF